MRIGSGSAKYEWVDGWGHLPETDSARRGWAHPGIVVSESGRVITFHPGEPEVLVFDADGALLHSWPIALADGHGITLGKEGEDEYLWFADPGRKRDPENGYENQYSDRGGQVVKATMDGRVTMSLEPPNIPVYRDGGYLPTSVAVNEERFGGNGDVWIADGYGKSHVHRFDRSGNYLSSINGSEGRAGAFDCPHEAFVDTRGDEPELYITDRSNSRIQVYDLDGDFKRAFGSDFLTSPSAFATHGDLLIVGELRARLTVLDADDAPVTYLRDNEGVCGLDGWPNATDRDGSTVRTPHLETTRFNSPHGIAVDGQGSIFVAEWLIGGRVTKLAR